MSGTGPSARRFRVGVVTDTHVGQHLAELPAEVCELLAGVDLILHAGDLVDPVVLERLGEVAPTVAVRGNHDRDAALARLPEALLVRVGPWRIGLTHGARTRLVELPAGAASMARGRPQLLGFHGWMRRRFGRVDCVVVGHLHLPIERAVGGVLVFSPGALYVPEHDPGQLWDGPVGRAYRRFRARLEPGARRPAVGILELGPERIRPRVLHLERPIQVISPGRPPPAATQS